MKWEALGDVTVMIVDDDEFNRQLVVSLLSTISTINFIEAQDGEEALAILEKTEIDMVLLDLHMPKLDGYETLKAIKKELKYTFIPVAIVTTDEQEMKKLYALGADDFLSKPFKLTELESRIYAHIEKSRYQKKYQELAEKKIEEDASAIKFSEEERSEEERLEEERLEESSEKDKSNGYSLEVIELSQKKFFYNISKLLNKSKEDKQRVKVVATLSRALSLLFGYNERISKNISLATAIRSIGALGLPNNTPPLFFDYSKENQEQYQKYIFTTHELLDNTIETEFIRVVKKMVIQHKEHYDGSGFPNKLKGNEIHNIAYIVDLVETFHLLLSKKEYFNNKIYSEKETYAILKRETSQRFHPKITKLFLAHFDYFIQLREKIIKEDY
jgi:putative two-component system response regulator